MVIGLLSRGLLVILLFVSSATSQQLRPDWAFSLASGEWDKGEQIQILPSGDVLWFGEIQGEADFSPGPDRALHGLGLKGYSPGKFLARYSSNSILKEVHVISDSLGKLWGGGIASDRLGNVYLYGSITGQVDIDLGKGEVRVGRPYGAEPNATLILVKYDSSLSLVWHRSFHPKFDENIDGMINSIENVVIGEGGVIFISGSFEGSFDIDPSSDTLYLHDLDKRSSHRFGQYTAKFSSVGDLLWAGEMGGGGPGFYIHDLSIDYQNNVYMTGTVASSVDLDFGPDRVMTLGGAFDEYMIAARYDSKMTLTWSTTYASGDYSRGWFIRPLPAGGFAIAGGFRGWVDFAPGVEERRVFGGGTYADEPFIATFSDSGKLVSLVTIRTISNAAVSGFDIRMDGTMLLTGSLETNTADFDPSDSVRSAGRGGFIASYSATGDFNWVASFGGSVRVRHGILHDDRTIFFTGSYSGTVDMDPGSDSLYLPTTGSEDGFIGKYRIQRLANAPITPNSPGPSVYPNPARDKIYFSCSGNAQLFSADGRILKTAKVLSHEALSIEDLSPGLYWISFSTQGKTENHKLIKD